MHLAQRRVGRVAGETTEPPLRLALCAFYFMDDFKHRHGGHTQGEKPLCQPFNSGVFVMTESKQLRDLRSVFSRIATDPNAWQLLRALPNPDPILRKAGKRAEVFAEITRDAHVIGELRSMRAGLLAYPTELVPGGSDAASMASYEVAKRLFSAEPGINSRWADIDWHLYSAILNGYACLHLGKFIQVEGFLSLIHI